MRVLPLMLLPLVTACATGPTVGSAICEGLEPSVAAHAAALAVSPDDASVVTGQALIARFDAACP